ncbi:hypothetical protein AS589_08060 [Empedobacter brevis]|uniref:lanthionine synthetase LanC family protein n=1 Tax=Empedobacter brevis TaxID=247 RepID=UPI00131FEE52|nr:lanthionine synthetase LanC family protein [Empedobacter brevis]QHC84741.1 hypothetical protein AS589_08060 [Empedobacter brevis]
MRKIILNKISEIEQAIYSNLENDNKLGISVMTGLGGIAVFYAQLLKISPNNIEYKIRYNHIIEKLFNKLNSEDFNLFYCDGLCGLATTLRLLEQNNLLEDYDLKDFFSETEAIFSNHLNRDIEDIEQIDFLHGNLGIINYFLNFSTSNIQVDSIKTIGFIDEYISSIELTNDNDKLINFGISHGMAGYLIILSKLYDLTENYLYKKIIDNIILIYLHFENMKEYDKSIFPTMAFTTLNNKQQTNLGWCYGDQTISYAINRASRSFNNDFLMKKSLDYSLYWSKKETCEKALRMPYDYMFCHGVSSVTYLNKKFFELTNKEVFKDNYNSFLKNILMHKDDGIGGYQRFSNVSKGYVNSLSVLDGIAGIGILLIDSYLENDKLIDQIFLLD